MNLMRWVRHRFPADSGLGRRMRMAYWAMQPGNLRLVHPTVLDALAQAKGTIHFIQVGSNDAGYGDPLRYHIINSAWRGIMIEPLPFIYQRLLKRYADVDGLSFENVAIDTQAGERNFYHLRDDNDPNLPPWYDQLGSFLKENVLKHVTELPDIAERLTVTPVQCASVDDLCVKHGLQQFDLLHIDAEGYDYQILKTVNLAKYQPAVVLFEHKHLSADEFSQALSQLHHAGYKTNSDEVDTLALAGNVLSTYPDLRKVWAKSRRRLGAHSDADHAGAH